MPGRENPSQAGAPTGAARRRITIAALLASVVFGLVLVITCLPWGKTIPPTLQAEWRQEDNGCCTIAAGHDRIFRFDGHSNRVLVADSPAFHFGTNQDFSVTAWIKAWPVSSKRAVQLRSWLVAHPRAWKFTPRPIAAWINNHWADNDYGVTPIVDKHQTPSSIQAVGFQMYLDHGQLACQLSAAPMRQFAFQNFVSPGPNLQDRSWHHVAMTAERNSATGGKLYVDGRQALVFDPRKQTGDLSNSEPLRIGNHANPTLRCVYKGLIGNVGLYRRALSAEEIAAISRAGRPVR
ncbi:MAG TPA: LamG domain-containing protein [Verrucomicrobiae bacterium]